MQRLTPRPSWPEGVRMQLHCWPERVHAAGLPLATCMHVSASTLISKKVHLKNTTVVSTFLCLQLWLVLFHVCQGVHLEK
jgi:hypothetical protein